VPVLPERVDAVGSLVYDAFEDVGRRYNYPPAFSEPEIAQGIVRLLVQTEGWQSYLIEEDDTPIACNFGDERDEAVGVGPVAVAPGRQGRGLGRRVMEALLQRAEANGVRSVRLLQAAYNLESFSLYHRLGFQVKALLVNLRGTLAAPGEPSDRVREFTPADLDACDALHREVMGIGRRNDIEMMAGVAPFSVAERSGRIAGYVTRFPGEETFITHGIAVDERAMRDLIAGTAASTSGPISLLLPSSQAETVRWAMGAGLELRELDSYMVYGEYQEPAGAWLPSPFY
jgi:GNAT superfamily N-acetyltransferase